MLFMKIKDVSRGTLFYSVSMLQKTAILAIISVLIKVGGLKMIYLDNSATSLKKPKSVAENMLYALNHFANPSRGAYPASLNAYRAIHECRGKIAELFNVEKSHQVAFTGNVTESLNLAADILVAQGDKVIVTVLDHNSILRPLYKRNVNLNIVGLDENGYIDYKQMEQYMKDGANSVFCTHASNVTGEVVDIYKIGSLCKTYGIPLVVDTAQSAGILEIDFQKANITILCFTGHKALLGPQGIGGMCVSSKLDFKPPKVGGSGINSFSESHPKIMPMALEAGTLNTPSIYGLSASLDFIKETGVDSIREHEIELLYMLYDEIKDKEKIKIYGNFDDRYRAPLIALNFADIDSGIIAQELWDEAEIAVRTGAHCAPLIHSYHNTKKQGSVRISLSYFNSKEEIEKTINAINKIYKKL